MFKIQRKCLLFFLAMLFCTCSTEASTESIELKSAKNHQWELTDYVWNLGIATCSDYGLDPNPSAYINYNCHASYYHIGSSRNAKSGDIVWMQTRVFPSFCRDVLGHLPGPVVLVLNDGDESFPSTIAHEVDVEQAIANSNIIHIFAQNCDYQGPSNKVSSIPIGIDFHTVAYRGGWWGEGGTPRQQELVLNEVLSELEPTGNRKIGGFIDFHLRDSMRGALRRNEERGEDRGSIADILSKTKLFEFAQWGGLDRSDLWKKKGQYAFSVSPWGNGPDCHRTWEDLVLGCIVLVKTSPIDSVYEGLPVVIVQEWSDITYENLLIWQEQYKDAFTNPKYREKLFNAYWINKIRATAAPFKKEN